MEDGRLSSKQEWSSKVVLVVVMNYEWGLAWEMHGLASLRFSEIAFYWLIRQIPSPKSCL